MTWFQPGRRIVVLSLFLALATFALYLPVCHFDFVQYDDPEYVYENPTVRAGLSWWGVVWSFVDAHASNWHPVTWLSHMLDCQLFGLKAGGHHLVSLLLHCANSALVLTVLYSVTGAMWRSAAVAALFAWHPLRVESVAWVAERKDVLSGFFFLLTIWAYIHFKVWSLKFNGEEAPDDSSRVQSWLWLGPQGSRSRKFYWLAFLFFALGLMSKPMLVTLPCVLLLLDFWPLNRVELFDRSGKWIAWTALRKNVRRLVLEKTPFFFLALVISGITFFSQRASGAMVQLQSEGIAARVGGAVVNYMMYLEKLVWPAGLSFLYLRPPAVLISKLMIATGVLVAFSVLATIRLRRSPYLAVGWLWFLGMLVPVCGLVQVGLQSVADRYTYLPAIGIFIIAIWGMTEMVTVKPGGRVFAGLLAGATLVICAAVTRHQLGFWANTEKLMQHALQVDPDNYIAHINLGVYYSKLGRLEEARLHRERAEKLDPLLANGSARLNRAFSDERK